MAVTADTFQEVETISQLAFDTAANWTSNNPVLPMAVWGYESDSGKLKLGDDATAWVDLAYKVDAPLSPEAKAILEKINQAGGAVVLDENGKIPFETLPDTLTGTIIYVADIAARNALAAEKKTGLVVVLDATADDGVDGTNGKTAMYAWGDVTDDSVENPTWIKVAETESLDVSLDGYFNVNTHTLDDIADGTSYVKMSVEEQTKLAGIEEGADVTDSENVRGAGAVMYGDKLMLKGVDAAQMKAAQIVAPVTPPVEA